MSSAGTVVFALASLALGVAGCGSSSGACIAPAATCPAALPGQGSACSPEGLACEYGDDPRLGCRSSARCRAGAWTQAQASCALLARCPTTFPDPCANIGDQCGSASGDACTCTNCVAACGGPGHWRCRGPNTDPGCPANAPDFGARCCMEGQHCSYQCGATGGRTCQGGLWIQTLGGACPASG